MRTSPAAPRTTRRATGPAVAVNFFYFADGDRLGSGDVDQRAADQVADVDFVVGEGGSLGDRDGDDLAFEGFSGGDGVDSGEVEDDAAFVGPVMDEFDFAGRAQRHAAPEASSSQRRLRWANFSGKSVRRSAKTSPLRPWGWRMRASQTQLRLVRHGSGCLPWSRSERRALSERRLLRGCRACSGDAASC